MSFRRTQNAHDQWVTYCTEHSSTLFGHGLPPELFVRADVFEAFMRDGSFRKADGSELVLSQITDSAFLAVEQFMNGYFDFQNRFPALNQERLRRFQRYG